jgi:hypothetical protein
VAASSTTASVFALMVKTSGFFVFLTMLHELPRIAPERRHRLNVFFDVNMMTSHCPDSTQRPS